jgi:predicted DNA-binding antitoxin AbrB/MazE fold protein
MRWELGGETMSKVIDAVYENGVFRPLEPVVLPEGEHVQVYMPELPPTLQARLAALDAFEALDEELTEEQWRIFEEATQRRPWFGGRQLDL